MTPFLSVYLDGVRFLAALVVFWGHISGQRLTGGLLWQFGPYASPAVVVFFVLSGFVVAYAADRPGTTARSYGVARAARIYSVALPALAVTFLLDSIGSSVNPGLYAPWWGYVEENKPLQYLTALTFTGHLWWAGISAGSNLPYWSLQFEVWYYVIFGIALFAPPAWRWPGLIVAGIIAGPPILVMLPLWLIGVATYRLCVARPLPGRWGAPVAIAAVLAWVGYEIAVRQFGRPDIGKVLLRPELIQDYIVAALFALHVLGLHAWTRHAPEPPRRITGAVRWLAGATFSLYLLHLPVSQFLAAVTPGPAADWGKRAVVVFGTLAVVFLLAEVTERRKDPWRRGIEAILNLFGRRQRSTA